MYNFSVDVRESMSENVAEIGNFKNTLKREEDDVNAREKEIHELETVQGLFEKNEKFQDKMSMKQKWARVKNQFKPEMEESEKKYNVAEKSVKALEKNLEIKEQTLLSKCLFFTQLYCYFFSTRCRKTRAKSLVFV